MSAAAAGEQRSLGSGRCLLFSLGDAFYRIELIRLTEVLPWAELEPADAAEASGLLGWLRLRGERLPVVDLNELVHGEPTARLLGSRILVLECRSRGVVKRIGALAGEVFSSPPAEENLEFAERFDPCDVLSSILARLA